MTAHDSRRSSSPSRRLPWWIRRAFRAWMRCQRWWVGSPARRAHACPALGTLDEMELQDAPHEQRPRGCGWFDSSQDLREGLCVSEHAAADAAAAQLPVMAWVELQLSGWRPTLTA